MKLKTLYKKTSTGAQQEWTISTMGAIITTVYGQTGGAMQTATDVIKEGKNVGRKNETTREQQAEAEALSQWEKKLKKGYHEDPDAAMKGKVSDVIEGGIFPMLAAKYSEQAEKIIWPAYVQPKLDGHRMTAVVERSKCTLWSRTRKPILSLPHIVAAVERLGVRSGVFDGEAYNHAYHDRFEELASFIRSAKPKTGCEVVQYHLYDYAEPQNPFDARFAKLEAIHGAGGCPSELHLVETVKVYDETEMYAAFQSFIEEGFEGAILRNAAGLYVNKRSTDLQKVKEFDDSEFEIVDVVEGRGKLAGHGIFVCKSTEAPYNTFECKMVGELSLLKQYYDRPKKFIGLSLTVKHQGWTKKNNVPRFPIGLRFRED
jgi:ATP-dependent DNA ligase